MHSFYESDGAIKAPGMRCDGKRPGYARWHREIKNPAQFYQTLRCGPYVWPGGYEAVFLCDDGGLLCWGCAREEIYNITWALRNKSSDGWRVVGVMLSDCMEEHTDCSHCNRVIVEGDPEDTGNEAKLGH